MENYLLTFEVDKEAEQIFIHGDPVGLERFANALLKIAKSAKDWDFPHDHFFAEEWGGDDLSSVPQSEDGKPVSHVQIYGWPTKEGAKPYEKT